MTSRLCNCACYSIRRFNPFWRSCMSVSRRDFLTGAVVGSLSLGSQGQDRKEREPKSPPVAQAGGKRPIIVCAGNGYDYLGDAYKFLSSGGDTLDAALRVVKGPEDDPKDDSVGLGGLPNEEGVVELDEMGSGIGIEPEFCHTAIRRVLFPPTGTIHCSALNERGEISGCTTTSGLAFKLPGRVGDSPIIGAGCYTDQDVGSAGATGSGEENIKVAGAHTIVENMRHGMSPLDAGIDALKRIVRNYNGDMNKLRFVDMTYYVLRKDGAYAGACLWEGYTPGKPHKIAVHDGNLRAEKAVNLLKGYSQEFPPFPEIPEDLKKDSEYLK